MQRIPGPSAALILATSLGLTACGGEMMLASMGFTALSLVETNKTPTDHGLSALLDQECSTIHTLKGEAYCRDKIDPAKGAPDEPALPAAPPAPAAIPTVPSPTVPPLAAPPATVFCHRTHGREECVARPTRTATAMDGRAAGTMPAVVHVPARNPRRAASSRH
ncbi:MAG TPA: hypothetical protein VEY95_01080 [Azospirillaceae bacterium]|nr:hypothetical protein [Azospirillaceae bacterium]